MSDTQKTILIIRTSALGDVAMAVPVIYALARQYPRWRVLVLTRPFFTRIFRQHPPNISFVLADWQGKHRGLAGLARLAQELARENIAAVADLHNVPRSWMIDLFFYFRGIPVAMTDKGRLKRRALTRLKNKHASPQRPYILRHADVLKRLHMPVRLESALLPSPAETRKRPLPVDIPQDGKPLVGVAPFARYPTKTYPPELMEQTVTLLAAQGCHVFLFGAKGKEERTLKHWEARHPGCTALPGRLEIEEELELMGRLDAMVSMDSANMHLASLAGIPVVSVWGSTTPQCGFMGWQQKEAYAICLHLPCQPCSISGRQECPLRHFDCMRSISPESVAKRVMHILSAAHRLRPE